MREGDRNAEKEISAEASWTRGQSLAGSRMMRCFCIPALDPGDSVAAMDSNLNLSRD
jgi:hypothetical protein